MASLKNARVVVTGAAGFIGSHLLERLLELGASVTAFVRYNSRNDLGVLELIGDKKNQVRIVSGDIRELETVRDLMKGVDVVFHLAALVGIPYSYVHPQEVVEVNTIGTFNVLTAARESGVKRVVVTSTSEVYGTALYVPIDEKHPKQPQSPYSASKIAADAIALSFYHSFQLPVTVIRPFNTYGPRQSDRAIIPTIIAQGLTKGEICLGNTAPTRDFTYVTDTAEGFVRAAESERSLGQEINLGSGCEISIDELAKKIIALLGKGVTLRRQEQRLRPPTSEVQQLLSANRRAKELLGWTPQVALDDGLQRTIAWMKSNMNLYTPGEYRI